MDEDELSALGITVIDQSTVEKNVQDKVDAALAEHALKQHNNILQKELHHIIADIETAERTTKQLAKKQNGLDGRAAVQRQQNAIDELQQRLQDIQNEISGNTCIGAPATEAETVEDSEWERQLREGEITPFSAQFSRPPVLQNTGNALDCQPPGPSNSVQKQELIADLRDRINPLVKKRPCDQLDGDQPTVSQLSRQTADSPLKRALLNPKKRPRLSNLGTESSNDVWDKRIKPGKLVSEYTAFQGPDDDSDEIEDVGSDYRPSDDNDFSDYDPEQDAKLSKNEKCVSEIVVTKSKSKATKNKTKSKSGNTSAIVKRGKDDGDLKTYHKRLKRWKQEMLKKKLERIENDCDDEDPYEASHELGRHMRVPSVIWEALYRYQQTGVQWLWELHEQGCGGILGDEMGLGKTVQVIAFLAGLRRADSCGAVLIVCPATLLHQWLSHFHLWWPPFRVAILHSSGGYVGDMKILMHNIHKDSGVLITSYSGARANIEALVNLTWHYVILDEGHQIRNPDSQVALALKQFNTPHRLILSGSPIQNSLKELWSLFDFVFPGKLGTLQVFLQQFAVPITQGGYSNASRVEVETGFKCATVLRDTISPYLLRRMKADVKTHINLPNKSEQVLFCGLTESQREIYKSYLAGDQVSSIMHGSMKVFVGLINLRKICNHPDLYTGGPRLYPGETIDDLPRVNRYGWWERSGKMQVVHGVLQLWHKQDHRVLLFTQSAQMLSILELFLQQQEYTYLKMLGKTPITARHGLVERFNSDSSVFVFLLTTRVGGIGVNLTGADRVLIYDPDWNPSTDTQARERAWRIGQLRNVTIYRLLTAGTIEEKIYHRQIFKQFLTNRVLKDPKQQRFFKRNDLFELFQLNEGGKDEKTESSALFAGLGSDIKVDTTEKATKPKNLRSNVKADSSRKNKTKSNGYMQDKVNAAEKIETKISSRKDRALLLKTEDTSTNVIEEDISKTKSDSVDDSMQVNNGNHAAIKKETLHSCIEITHLSSNTNSSDAIVSSSNGDDFEDLKLPSTLGNEISSAVNTISFIDEDSNMSGKTSSTVCSSIGSIDQPLVTEYSTGNGSAIESERELLPNTGSTSVNGTATSSDAVQIKADPAADPARERMRLLAKMLSQKIASKSICSSSTSKSKPSQIKDKKYSKSSKSSEKYEKKGKKFEGTRIKYLVKKRDLKKKESEEERKKEVEKNKSQNDYVLTKLFKTAGVHTALSHDAIVGSNDADYLLLEGEADRVAKDAMKLVKASRSQCFRPTLPRDFAGGSSNDSQQKLTKKRFGARKQTAFEVMSNMDDSGEEESLATNGDDDISMVNSANNIFARGGLKNSGSGQESGTSGAMSSAELLQRMRRRNQLVEGNDSDDDRNLGNRDVDPITAANVDLLTDIRTFVTFQASVDGRASTEEILNKFRDKLPKHKTHIFKALLKQICDFRKDYTGVGMWHIKQEFQ